MAYQSYAATDGSATCRAPADGGQIDSPFGKEEDKLQKMKWNLFNHEMISICDVKC